MRSTLPTSANFNNVLLKLSDETQNLGRSPDFYVEKTFMFIVCRWEIYFLMMLLLPYQVTIKVGIVDSPQIAVFSEGYFFPLLTRL